MYLYYALIDIFLSVNRKIENNTCYLKCILKYVICSSFIAWIVKGIIYSEIITILDK